jgi:hypothetical protein
MICPYCGKENLEHARLCDYCGGFLLENEKPGSSELYTLVSASQPELPPAETASQAEQPAVPPEALPSEPLSEVIQPATQPEIYPAEQYQPPAKGSKRGCGKWIWWLVGCFVVLCLLTGCIAALWGLYSSTSVLNFLNPPSPTPATVQETTNLLLSDDFSDPNSGWDRVNKTDYSSDYFENAYRIQVNKDMTDIWANPDSLSYGDVSVEVDATKNGGPDRNDFGVICRYQDIDHYYYGIITSDGYYGILKSTTNGSEFLGGDSLVKSELVQQGLSTHHIRFDCVGNELTLYADGQQLDQQTDNEFLSGNVGLTAGTYETPGTEILFDNFKVYQP